MQHGEISDYSPGWYRGFSTKNRAVKGIFPSSYVHLKPCKIDNEGLFESVIPLEDPVVREVTLVLREWGSIWKRLYVVSVCISSSASFLSANLSLPAILPLCFEWGDGDIKTAIDDEKIAKLSFALRVLPFSPSLRSF